MYVGCSTPHLWFGFNSFTYVKKLLLAVSQQEVCDSVRTFPISQTTLWKFQSNVYMSVCARIWRTWLQFLFLTRIQLQIIIIYIFWKDSTANFEMYIFTVRMVGAIGLLFCIEKQVITLIHCKRVRVPLYSHY